jgi:peptidylprolyl isomerase/peptidyl-prolyl cis-trans isomerase B (cyclophilin B)
MANKRTRDRQLAKLAARRQAERRARRRKRNAALGAGLAVAVVAIAAAFLVISGGGEQVKGAASTPSSTASPGTGPVACGAKAPKSAGQNKPTFSKPPAMTIDPSKTYTATLHTSCGTISIGLDASAAPQNVNSFVFLVRKGFYDGLTFHRIANSIDVIQGGDPQGNGSGGPGYQLKDELSGKERYTPGVVAMANAGPDTAGSQFFIVTGPKASSLPKSYTIIGRVTHGLDVARRIQGLPVNGETPTQRIYIDKATVAVGG